MVSRVEHSRAVGCGAVIASPTTHVLCSLPARCNVCARSDGSYHETCDTILNVSPIIITRITSVYAVVLQALATDANIRSTLHITAPPRVDLAASMREVRRYGVERAGRRADGMREM